MKISKLREKLIDEYKYKIEMHAHTTPASACSDVLPEDLVEMYHKKGYNGVVVTNHFNNYNVDRMPELDKEDFLDAYIKNIEDAEKAAEKYGMKIYWGTELRFDENSNDYLIYGVDREVLSVCYDYFSKDLATFRKEVKFPKSVLIHAHPFRSGMTLMPPELVDGIEILNLHPGHNSAVANSTRYAYETKAKIKTAGSDFHDEKHLACSALRVKAMPEDSFGLAKILKSGDYILEIGENAIVLP